MDRLASIARLLAFWLIVCTHAHAGFTFLGPTPYLSAADSPFNLSGLGTSFFLEDFEEFEANTPGLVPVAGGGAGPGASVDGDDGLIDGSGTAGKAMSFASYVCSTNHCGYRVSFEFDSVALGFLPTALGMVLISGGGPTTELLVVDALGNEKTYDLEDISLNWLETYDDRFIGIRNPIGISRFEITKSDLRQLSIPILIDHIQYGLFVLEPNVLNLVILGGITLCCQRGGWHTATRAA